MCFYEAVPAVSSRNYDLEGAVICKRCGPRQTLVGKYFITHCDKKLRGCVFRVLGGGPMKMDDGAIVQLYSWMDGRPSIQKLVFVRDMVDWDFYSRFDEWREACAKMLDDASADK